MAKLKIQGDTSEIKRSLLDLSKDVKALGKSKIAIFDKQQQDFLTKEATKHLGNIKNAIAENGKQIALNVKLQDKQGRSLKEQIRTRERITKLMQDQVKLQKQASQFEGLKSGGGGRGISGLLRGGLGKMGMGAGALRMMGPIGAALGIGAFGFSRGRKAFGTYSGGISDRMMLRGRGVTDMDLNDPSRASRAGMGAQDVRRARLGSMDIFGREGATQRSVIQRAEMERNFGVQSGTMQGVGAQLRGNVGGAGANKAVMTVQASLIASGITDEIGPYLETAATMLTSLTEDGMTFSGTAMTALTGLIAKGASAERAGRLVTGVDKAFRSSGGEQGALFRSVMAGAGIAGGNQTVGILDFMRQSGGLFGTNLDEGANPLIQGRSRKVLRGLGGGERTGQQVATSALKLFDRFGDATTINKLLESGDPAKVRKAQRMEIGRAQGIAAAFGVTGMDAMRIQTLFQQMSSGDPSATRGKVEKELKRMQEDNTELGNLKLISKSNAGILDATNKLRETTEDVMGNQVAPAVIALNKTMLKLDTGISAILSFFGVETAEQKAEKALSGIGQMSKEDLDQITGGDPKRQRELSEKLATEIEKKQARSGELREKRKSSFLGLLGPSENTEALRLFSEVEQMKKTKGMIDRARGNKGRPALGKSFMSELMDGQESRDQDPLTKMLDSLSSSEAASPTNASAKADDSNKVLREILEATRGVQKENQQNTKAVERSAGVGTKTVRND